MPAKKKIGKVNVVSKSKVKQDDIEDMEDMEDAEGVEAEEEVEDEQEDVVEEEDNEPEVRVSKSGHVQISMLRTLDPAPVVGNYSFRRHGVVILERGKVVVCPREVALHLVDKKAAVIVAG